MSIITSFPTILVALGFLEFIFQILLRPQKTDFWGISVIIAFCLLIFNIKKIIPELKLMLVDLLKNKLLAVCFLLLFFILLLSAFVSIKPPHLSQEFDAINYHMGLPLQHILRGSLSHIAWSSADLWPPFIQWGLSSFWFMFSIPHKLPQFIFVLWSLGLSIKIGSKIYGKTSYRYIPALAFFTTHGVLIQLGTAMMDLVFLYFLIAALNNFIEKNYLLTSLHTSLFATSKAFMPGLMLFIFILTLIFLFRTNLKNYIYLFSKYKKYFLQAVAFSLLLLSRSIYVGVEQAGTPFFPFAPCFFESVENCKGPQSARIKQSAELQRQVRDHYGNGRGFEAFLLHFIELPVPTKGANNSFDYPLGWAWVLFVVLFLFSFKYRPHSGLQKLLLAVAVSFWIMWWFGSQQSRWLYPVLLLGFFALENVMRQINLKVLLACLFVSAVFSSISLWRAHRASFALTRNEIFIQERSKENIQSMRLLYVEKPIHEIETSSPLWVIK